MTAHDHRTVVPGCYRCELNADEMDPAFDWPRLAVPADTTGEQT